MEIILSILLISLMWMIYDILNAPAVDEDEKTVAPVLHEETKSFLKSTKH